MRLVAVQSGGSTVADLVNEALGAFERRDRDRAAALLSEAVKSEADLGAKWGAVSRLASTVGAISAALTAAERHVRADPDNPVPRLAFGEMLAHHGRVAAACAIGTALTRDHPSNPAAWHFLGTCLAQTGEHEASMSALRQAMALHTHPSGLAWSWQALAEMKTFSEHDSDLGAMNDLLHRFPTTTLSESRSVLMYGIGKAHDDIGNVDEAFAAYAEGARLSRQLHHYDRKQTQSFVDQIVGGWTSQFATSLPCSGIESTRPVFVFGLPRSGTTLVEQILVGHDDVSDGAEINLFSTAAMPIKGFTPRDVEAFAKTHGADGFAAVGESYLDMLNDRFGKDGRIIDKTLNHSRYLGLIHHVLPNARFIWLSRSPGAVAWSCFRTRFARGVDWSWSMEDMAHYFAGEDRLREHWCAQLGEAILTVPYEALVGDIELWIGKILAHVGLRPQAGLGDFHLTKRAVTTASFAQVRKPLYTSSRDAWRRYEAHLAPFFKAYQD